MVATTPIDAKPIIIHEAADWGTDPDSGAKVVRLTSGALWSHNIYCEQPYASPDGRRVLIGRAADMLSESRQLLSADMNTLSLSLVEADVPSELVAHTSWGEWAYYPMRDGSLRRLSMLTLEREVVSPAGSVVTPPHGYIETASPDGRLLAGYERTPAGHLRSFILDLSTGQSTHYFDCTENRNPHAQFDLGNSSHILHQLLPPDQPGRVRVVARHIETGEVHELPFGGASSAESSGHMAWIAETGKVACAVNWLRAERRHDPRHPQGNLLVAAPGDKSYRVIDAPQHAFYHVSVSRCGRYFVCDDFMDFQADAFRQGAPGPVRIVVGSFHSGQTRILLRDCQAYGIAGSSRYEPTPYFTADNQHVIYNASPFGINQVFAAQVPTGLLQALD